MGRRKVTRDGSKAILTARVRHSQRISGSGALLRPWIPAEKSGVIVCADCTCMAGLGAACSYVAALLFAAEAHTRMIQNASCISVSCQWLSPTTTSTIHQSLTLICLLQYKKEENVNVDRPGSTETNIRLTLAAGNKSFRC